MHIDDEVTARIAKASVAFGRLRGNVCDRRGIRLDTKLKVYKAVVPPTFLYACGTWTVHQCHAKNFNHFHLSCLRKLLQIRWENQNPRYRGHSERQGCKACIFFWRFNSGVTLTSNWRQNEETTDCYSVSKNDPAWHSDEYCWQISLRSSLFGIEWGMFELCNWCCNVVTAIWIRCLSKILYNSLFCFLSDNYINLTKANLPAFVAYVYLVMNNWQTDCWFHKLDPFEMSQCFFCQFGGFADVIINGHLKGENAISWSKGDINEFSKEENNN